MHKKAPMTILPSKIFPEPIIDTTVELRFSTVFPSGAIFGIVYSLFKDKYPTVEQLPILQVPEEIRRNDFNFKFKPLYKLISNEFVIQVGYDVITLHSKIPYVGWENFLVEIKLFFEKINTLDLVQSPIQLLLRYVNFFEINILQHLNLDILLMEESLQNHLTIIRTEIQKEDLIQVVQIANNSAYTVGAHSKNGSLVDITIVMNTLSDFFDNVEVIVNKAHKSEKELFFGMLKSDFLKSLKPQY